MISCQVCFFLSAASWASCEATVVLAILVCNQISLPSSHPGMDFTQIGVDSIRLAPLRIGHQLLALAVEIVVKPSMRPFRQSTSGFEASRKG